MPAVTPVGDRPLDEQLKTRWLREFRLNGFVVLRDFLPVDLVAEMQAQLTPIVLGEWQKALEGRSAAARAPGRLAFDVGRWADAMGGPLADDRYRRHPVIEALVAEILAPAGGMERGWSQVECCFNGCAHMSWHSDQVAEDTPDPDAPNRTIRVTYNIPLVEFTPVNGATEFLPGSHLLPRRFLSSTFLDVTVYPVAPQLRRGDALLRDGNTLHRGTPNLMEEPRPMLDQTYRAVRARRMPGGP